MMYLVLFLLIRLNYYHHHHQIHQYLPMMDLMVAVVVVDVERKIDYDDDEMKNIDLMENDQDLLKMIDNSFSY